MYIYHYYTNVYLSLYFWFFEYSVEYILELFDCQQLIRLKYFPNNLPTILVFILIKVNIL